MRKQMVFLLICAISCFGVTALAETEVALGDLNNDGKINILDVQRVIGQALQYSPQTSTADLDENGQVDVTDVQNLVNSVLGLGGVVQKIKGTVAATPELLQEGMTIVAMSYGGETAATASVNEDGTFSFALPIKNVWWLAFVPKNAQCAGLVQYVIKGTATTLLPLLDLSECDTLDLGTLTFADRMLVAADLRDLMGAINNRNWVFDADANGIPDTIDRVFARGRAMLEQVDPDAVQEHDQLQAMVDDCIRNHVPELSTVSLTDDNNDHFPDFLEPMAVCLHDSLIPWLQAQGDNNAEMHAIHMTNMMKDKFIEALDEANVPALKDTDGNGIPDRWAPWIGNLPIDPSYDTNANGVPDVVEISE